MLFKVAFVSLMAWLLGVLGLYRVGDLKRMIGRVARRTVRTIKKVAERLDPEPSSSNAVYPGFAYASINTMLGQLMAESPRVLYPQYTWGVLQAAHLARALGIERISVVEFGVAGGNGLVALESAAAKVEALSGVEIDVHGFDTGEGLPPVTDYRDLPHLYRQSEYRMDVERLLRRLRRAQLHIGLVADTLKTLLASKPAPIGFVSFDLDLYTSTVDAFAIFEQAYAELTLPRVHCYFDDIMGLSYSEFTGERLAIKEFNAKHRCRKIDHIFGLKYFLPAVYARQQWSEMFYLAHLFDHPLAGRSDGLTLDAERPLARPVSQHVAPLFLLLSELPASTNEALSIAALL